MLLVERNVVLAWPKALVLTARVSWMSRRAPPHGALGILHRTCACPLATHARLFRAKPNVIRRKGIDNLVNVRGARMTVIANNARRSTPPPAPGPRVGCQTKGPFRARHQQDIALARTPRSRSARGRSVQRPSTATGTAPRERVAGAVSTPMKHRAHRARSVLGAPRMGSAFPQRMGRHRQRLPVQIRQAA